MRINITKAEIKGYNGLAYNYIQKTDDNFENKINTKSQAPVHDDLRHAFMRFTPHLAFICEQIDKNKCEACIEILKTENYSLNEDEPNYSPTLAELYSNFTVESFEIRGKEDNVEMNFVNIITDLFNR